MGDSETNKTNNNNKPRKSRGKRVRRTAENVIMLCLAVIVVFSGWKIYSKMHEYKVNRDTYKSIADLAVPKDIDGIIDFDALRKINPDIVGWIRYEGTNINYPIVQGKDNDYYIRIAFDNTWAIGGTIFVDANTENAFKQFSTIVYGHHMQDGSMFGDLKKLKEKSYCDEHPQLELITPEGRYHLNICAFLNQPADSEIYTINIRTDSKKQAYIDMIRSLANYTTDEEMTTDSRLVVLSTCAYEYQDARYMVIAKMVDWE